MAQGTSPAFEVCRGELRMQAFETWQGLARAREASRRRGFPFRAAGLRPIHRERWRGSSTNMESGRIGLGGKRNHAGTQFGEQFLIKRDAAAWAAAQIDGPAIDEGKFAMDGWRGLTPAVVDGCEHSSRESLQENEMR